MRVLVYWLSRHRILPKQRRELERIMNKWGAEWDLRFRDYVQSPDSFLSELPLGEYDRIVLVAVLPLTVIDRLARAKPGKVEVWMPLMDEKAKVPTPYAGDALEEYGRDECTVKLVEEGWAKIYCFRKFVRVREVRVVWEEIT